MLKLVGENLKDIYSALEKINENYILIMDIETMIIKIPKSFIEKIGISSETTVDLYTFWKNLIDKRDKEKFFVEFDNLLSGKIESIDIEYCIRDRKGKIIWLRQKGSLIKDETGKAIMFIGVVSILGKQNKIDSVTGLLKIADFFETFNKKLKIESIKNLGMMIIGVDNFKHINQLHSRQYGDRILKILANTIQYLLPEEVYLYKLDGDTFGIILEDMSKEEAEELYLNIKYSIKGIQMLKEKNIYLNISAGCVIYPRNLKNCQEIYKSAMYSLMYSKKTGKDKIVFFSDEVMSNNIRTFELLYYLKQDIENKFENFEVFYQPQISADDGRLIGFEALLRWKCEKFGVVSPVEFIPLLEETGMIIPVGKWILGNTLVFFKSWLDKYPDLKISINLSCVQLRSRSCVSDFRRIIEKVDFPVKNINFEITESTTIKNMGTLRSLCEKIHSLNIGIALDDFGTGYSSFGVLKEIPVDIVKIDRSFTKDILESSFNRSFIKFIVEICHQYNIKLCLEGVETIEELEVAKELKVDYIQGYYFGKPESKEIILEKYYIKN